MEKMVKSFFGITFSFILLASLGNLVLAQETNWGDQVYSALESVPQGTSQYEKASVIYQKYYEDSDRLYKEEMPNSLENDPLYDKCSDACGPMPNPSPTDIDLDNPDAWSKNNKLSFDEWDACRKKCNAEASARDEKLYKEFDEKLEQLAEKAIADINAIKSGQTVANKPESGGFNTNSNRGRDEFGRMMPSIEGYLGYAYVERLDGTKVIPGHELYLKVGDSVVSGQKSNINIIFSNAGKMDLGPNTVARVGNALLDQYYLAKGTLKSKINLMQVQKFEIDTPNAAIFAKGTEFIVDYNETSNVTLVYLNEGTLEIEIRNQIVNLAAGNYLVIYHTGETWQYSLKPEKWADLGNNFYEIPDVDKRFDYIVLMIDLIIIFILFLWMKKKIKNTDKKDKSTSKGTASLVLAMLGAIFLLIAPYIGIIFSTIGFCLSKIQKANNPTGQATIGFILCLIGLISNMALLIMAL